MSITSSDLLINLKSVFLDQDKYYFDKHVPEFMHNGDFLGDCYSMIMVEPKATNPPRFFHTFSPFDVISSKAPDRALVYENGNLLLDIDFAKYIAMRTGAMDTLVLQGIGAETLKNKNILYIGSGKIAHASLEVLKNHFGDVLQIDCINNSGDFTDLSNVSHSLGIVINKGDLKNIEKYDYIFCHTNTKEPILTKDLLSKIKHGAVITTTISSTEHGEVTDEYFDTKNANVICDWQQTLIEAKDINRSIENGLIQKEEVVLLKTLLSNPTILSLTKNYTIYRSTGTPLQNLAVLQLLVSNNKK